MQAKVQSDRDFKSILRKAQKQHSSSGKIQILELFKVGPASSNQKDLQSFQDLLDGPRSV